MNRDEIVTNQHLSDFGKNLLNQIEKILEKKTPKKLFISPKEFAALTGISYSTSVNMCKDGRLKARQETPNGSWLISASELERFKNEANDNNSAK